MNRTEAMHRVTTTDWWKVAALVVMLADHYGFYFEPDEAGWRIIGRLTAPIFFFLIGFARTRTVPWTWIAFGVVITALDAATDETPFPLLLNILLNFALIRAALPWFERTVLPSRARLLVFVAASAGLALVVDPYLEYGTEGWLWALVGLLHRQALETGDALAHSLRNLVATLTAAVYVALQTVAFGFEPGEIVALALLVAGLTILLAVFRRGPSAVQPPAPAAALVGFLGRRTLEIYALHLIALELHVLLT